jgi:hypothetical protein
MLKVGALFFTLIAALADALPVRAQPADGCELIPSFGEKNYFSPISIIRYG